MAEVAALARIDERATPREAGGKGAVVRSDQAVHRGEREPRMTEHTTTQPASGAQATQDTDRQLKAATRAAWALGDYHRFALETVWGLVWLEDSAAASVSFARLSRKVVARQSKRDHALADG
jgi:hypothetical protein